LTVGSKRLTPGIEEAKAENKVNLQLSVQAPVFRTNYCHNQRLRLTANHYYKQTETPRKIAQIFTNPVRIVNELLAAVGILV